MIVMRAKKKPVPTIACRNASDERVFLTLGPAPQRDFAPTGEC
jgi:hypothetical protein